MKVYTSFAALLASHTSLAAGLLRPDAYEHFEKGSSRILTAANVGGPDVKQIFPDSFSGYDANWAGAIVESSGIQTVTGTFNVPNIDVPPGGAPSGTYGAASWVGIDGKTCKSAILQTGVMYNIQSGQPQYHGWFEWFPNPPGRWTEWSVSPGDQITATVVAYGVSSGIATLINTATGQSVTKEFSNMENLLCQQDAEWIIEDYKTSQGLIPLANFNTVAFSGAGFSYSGVSGGISGASVVDIEQNGQILTGCTVTGSSGLTCSYQ